MASAVGVGVGWSATGVEGRGVGGELAEGLVVRGSARPASHADVLGDEMRSGTTKPASAGGRGVGRSSAVVGSRVPGGKLLGGAVVTGGARPAAHADVPGDEVRSTVTKPASAGSVGVGRSLTGVGGRRPGEEVLEGPMVLGSARSLSHADVHAESYTGVHADEVSNGATKPESAGGAGVGRSMTGGAEMGPMGELSEGPKVSGSTRPVSHNEARREKRLDSGRLREV